VARPTYAGLSEGCPGGPGLASTHAKGTWRRRSTHVSAGCSQTTLIRQGFGPARPPQGTSTSGRMRENTLPGVSRACLNIGRPPRSLGTSKEWRWSGRLRAAAQHGRSTRSKAPEPPRPGRARSRHILSGRRSPPPLRRRCGSKPPTGGSLRRGVARRDARPCRPARRRSRPTCWPRAPRLSRGALGRRRAAIGTMHRNEGLPVPVLDRAARAALRGAARPKTPPRPALPCDAAGLDRLAARCPGDLAGLRDRALLLWIGVEVWL